MVLAEDFWGVHRYGTMARDSTAGFGGRGQKRQIMHGIKDLSFLLPAPLVFGDHPIGIALDHHGMMGVFDRNGIVISIKPHQGLGIGDH